MQLKDYNNTDKQFNCSVRAEIIDEDYDDTPSIEFLQKCADTTEITNTLGKWLDAKPDNKELLGIY